jgi:arylsulfatase
MATFLDVARIPYPSEHGGRRVQPLEGESFAPVLSGNRWSRDQAVFWEHEGNRAVRQGRWKLVSRYPYRWELYDMAADRTELNDLADRNRPQVKEMAAAYDEWAARCGVVNWEQLA